MMTTMMMVMVVMMMMMMIMVMVMMMMMVANEKWSCFRLKSELYHKTFWKNVKNS